MREFMSEFLKMNDQQFVAHLKKHGLTPTESEMGPLRGPVSGGVLEEGIAVVLDPISSDLFGGEVMYYTPSQKDGWPVGESSAK